MRKSKVAVFLLSLLFQPSGLGDDNSHHGFVAMNAGTLAASWE
ncbi:hypothetical protein [Photobacterium sp. GSS17]|nr:hypothetical protein [Photobacterium sp. GSS17]